jgi:hypothetical protein
LSWRQLWIEVCSQVSQNIRLIARRLRKVRCSDSKLGKDSSDPDNRCGDGKPNDGNCPGGTPPAGGTNQVEAFSEPDGKYSRITFCNDFFSLNSLSDAVKLAKAKPREDKNDLTNWNNRARVFFHEVTHLDYFMNAGDDPKDKSPYVTDLKFKLKVGGLKQEFEAYGPFNAKIVRNYVTKKAADSAYYSQRNGECYLLLESSSLFVLLTVILADNYAYFALAKYVQKIIGRYVACAVHTKRPIHG